MVFLNSIRVKYNFTERWKVIQGTKGKAFLLRSYNLKMFMKLKQFKEREQARISFEKFKRTRA